MTVSFLPAPTKSWSFFQSPFQSLFPPPSKSAFLSGLSAVSYCSSLCRSRKVPSSRKQRGRGFNACASLYSSIELCIDCWLVPEQNCFIHFIQLSQLLMAGIQSPLSYSLINLNITSPEKPSLTIPSHHQISCTHRNLYFLFITFIRWIVTVCFIVLQKSGV